VSSASASVGTVSALWRYPVKSMQGEQVDTYELSERGFTGDRAWALVDQEAGLVVSAKHPRKWGAVLQCSARLLDDDATEITLPDGASVRSDDPDVDTRLSAAFGREIKLMSSAPDDRHYEMLSPNIDGVVPEEFIAENRTSDEPDGTLTDLALGLLTPPGAFFDLTTVHAITSATLAQLGADVRRFRPNVVIDVEGQGYVENGWAGQSLAFGPSAVTQVVIPTMRCVMTTLPQPGLPQDKSVLQTLARENRVEIPGMGTWACAGIYATVSTGGPVTVGDEVALSA
jgi:uncharacterized protein YcbX